MGYQRRARGFEPKEQYYNRMAGYLTLWAALLQAEAVPIYDERTEQMRMEPHANPAGAAEARRSLGACGRRPALDEVSRNFPAGVALARAARQPKGAASKSRLRESPLCSTFEMASVPEAVSSTPFLDARGACSTTRRSASRRRCCSRS